MAYTELQRTAELLREAAADCTGEPKKRLEGFADECDELAEREKKPDHGRLDKIQNGLHEIAGDVDPEVARQVQQARKALISFRKTVPGV
ncbi:DUF7553 family protein [Natronomonas sp. EA1]|uniref:DUF7553 family protein n=1 Tax=Natronomonas sp. EA1 TaxID=3421655 RepID=UPI003EB9559E